MNRFSGRVKSYRLATCALLLVLAAVMECCTGGEPTPSSPQPPMCPPTNASCPPGQQPPPCQADPAWLEQNAPLAVFNKPAPCRHDQCGTDCPFYQAAWQVFLYATHPVAGPDGKPVPRFLVSSDFTTIEDTFKITGANSFPAKPKSVPLSLGVRSVQRANSDPSIGAGVSTTVSLSPVVDKNGRPLFYAIHFNKTMKDFFTTPDPSKPDRHLLSPQDVQNAQQDTTWFGNLEFPAGSIEIKSAWQIVDDSAPPSNYFVTKAVLPVLKAQTNPPALVVDSTKDPVEKTVALVGIHIVFTLQDHPEFIWSTFEHVDADANPDTAPSAAHNPPIPAGSPPLVPSPVKDFLLFKSGTQLADANQVVTLADIQTNFDATTQSFKAPFQTPIYRVYRASKADDTQGIDDEVQSVNDSMTKIFKSSAFDPKGDQRNCYRLVGAVWMDDPRGIGSTNKKFVPGMLIRNDPGQSPDDVKAKVAGEDRLSGTALESFTQFDTAAHPGDPLAKPNCFFCHDAHFIKSTDNSSILLKDSKLNVSHVLSRFLLNAPSPSPAPTRSH